MEYRDVVLIGETDQAVGVGQRLETVGNRHLSREIFILKSITSNAVLAACNAVVAGAPAMVRMVGWDMKFS